MKLIPKPIVCERCGDEMLPSEQSRPNDRICPWCRHMMMEAKEIYRQRKFKRLSPVIQFKSRN